MIPLQFRKKIAVIVIAAVLVTLLIGSATVGYATLKMRDNIQKTLDVQLNEVLPKEMAKSVQEPITEEAGTITVSAAELGGARLFDDYFDKMRMMGGDVAVQDVLEAYSKYDESDPQFKAFLLKRFEMVKNLDPNVAYVYFGSTTGGMYMWPDEPLPEGYDPPRVRPWYKEAVDKNGPVWTEPYKDASTGKWIVTFSEPVYINGGEFVGVIGVDVFVSTLIDQAKQIKIGQTGYIAILNKDGTIIVHPPDESLVQKLNIHDDPNLASLAGELDKNKETGWIRYTFKGVDKIGGYKRMKTTGWIVLATVPINELTDPMMNAIDSSLKANTEKVASEINSEVNSGIKTSLLGSVFAAVFGLIVLGIAYRTLNTTLKPLEQLRDVAQALADGRLSEVREKLRGIQYLEDDEIGALIKAFESVGKDLVGGAWIP